MDLSYARTNITGYKGHLAAQTVMFPLKYPTVLEEYTPNEQFHRQLANMGNIINLNQIHATFIDQISYLLLNDMKTIVFTPLNAQVNNFDLEFQSLKVVLPHEIKSSHCMSVHYEKPQADNEGWILVDLIDKNYLFITMRISLTDFIVETSKKNKLSLNTFDQWGKISIPYSFELRSPPAFMKAIDSCNVIVSLKDGGLLHFQRSGHLSDFDVHNFNDPTSMIPLNLVSGLFRKGTSNQDIVLDGVSSNSVADLIAVNDHILITLTVNKVLKFWNLESHQQSHSPIDLKDSKSDLKSDPLWLTSLSAKYLQIVNNESTGKSYLTCYFSTASNTLNNGCNNIGLVFKTWEILDYGTQIELVSLDRLTFEPQLSDLFISHQSDEDNLKFTNSMWFVQDFACDIRKDYFNYHILWKSNTSSILVTYKIRFDNGAVESINWSQPNNNTPLSESASYHDSEYYANKVLNSENYDDLIITSATNIFREHIGLESIKFNSNIRELVHETVNKASKEKQELKLSWYKLDSLCEEFKKVSEESLAFCITNNSTILSLNVNNISIFRHSHYYEQFYNYKPSSSEGKLGSILDRLSVILSQKTYHKVYQGILKIGTSKMTANDATALYDTILSTKISSDEISLIMRDLESIPDILDVIASLIESRFKENTLDEAIDARKLNTSATIGTLTKLNTISSFRNIKHQHESILLNLSVLFLICEVNEQILLLLNKLIEKLAYYGIVDIVFNTCFESNNADAIVERSNVSNSENSLFWTGVVNRNLELNNLIKEGRLNEGYDFFYEHIISNYDKFILDIIIELINRGEGLLIKEKFFTKLNESKIIDKFLIGLVYLINNEPLQFFMIFEQHDFFKLDNDTVKDNLRRTLLKSLSVNPRIKSFLNSIFSDQVNGKNDKLQRANYFHALSELSKSQARDYHRSHHRQKFITPTVGTIDTFSSSKGPSSNVEGEFIQNALRFEKTAVEILKDVDNPEESIILQTDQYYLNIFEMAISSLNYDLVYECLSNLSSSKNSTIYDYRDLLGRFINNLMLNHKISIIFPPNSNGLYLKHYLLIDSILLDLANNELTLANSLKCYEYLYTWRLFGPASALKSSQLADKRGAAEALYMFITRFKVEQKNLLTNTVTIVEDIKQYKLKILELYMIILNCLKSFDNDEEKWIIKSKKAGSLSVIKLDELNLEYYEWLRELEDDLS